MIAEKINIYPKVANLQGWCSEFKANRIYQLILECDSQFTVELGAFGGKSLIPMALAHKEKGSGFCLGVDAWKAEPCISPENTEANNEWWRNLDFKAIYDGCQNAIFENEVEDYCDTLRSRTQYASFIFDDNTMDVLHQDSSHNKSTIVAELKGWIKKLKVGGYWIIDDALWPETKEGYSELPNFGLELFEDHNDWQIWKKDKMILAGYDIKPILLYLPENPEKYDYIKNHLSENGFYCNSNPMEVSGINAEKFGINSIRYYLRDNPESDYIQPQRKTGCTISHYLLYTVMASHPEIEYWMIIEDDCIFLDGWKEQFETALNSVPKDFDFLSIGNCCTTGRETSHIAENVYDVKYPLCTHCLIVAKKAIPVLLANCRDASQPIDVLLFYEVYPKCKVYTILPRLVNQLDTELTD